MNPLEQYPQHKKILGKLFEDVDKDGSYKILDAGSGRTSLYFLASRFPNSLIKAVVYPGDERKIKGIKKDVNFNNFELIECDIQDYDKREEFNIVLAHLLLGEANKFGNSFENILKTLFSLNVKHLFIVDIPEDPDVDFDKITRMTDRQKIIKIANVNRYRGIHLHLS